MDVYKYSGKITIEMRKPRLKIYGYPLRMDKYKDWSKISLSTLWKGDHEVGGGDKEGRDPQRRNRIDNPEEILIKRIGTK